MIVMDYVKDTNNITSTDIWCAGEYNGNVSSFSHAQSSIITNSYSIIGESSIKIGRTSADVDFINIPIEISNNGTYTVTMNVLNMSGANSVLRWISDGSVVSEVIIPQSNYWQTITLSANVTNGAYVRLMQYGTNNNLFFDNVRAVKL